MWCVVCGVWCVLITTAPLELHERAAVMQVVRVKRDGRQRWLLLWPWLRPVRLAAPPAMGPLRSRVAGWLGCQGRRAGGGCLPDAAGVTHMRPQWP